MLYQAADDLYVRARERARWGQLLSTLTGRSHCLLTLDQINAPGTAHGQRYLGIQSVPICHIRGSQNRTGDFDRDFNPLQDHNRGRWLRVAGARRQGKALPPVDLVQVGDLYFVQDGHHRISVARALGQKHIEARVTAWQVNGPSPRETGTQTTAPKTGIGRLNRKMWKSIAGIQKRPL